MNVNNKKLFSAMMLIGTVTLLTPSVLHAGVLDESKDMLAGVAAEVRSGAQYAGTTIKSELIRAGQKARLLAPYVITSAVVGTTGIVSTYVLLSAVKLIKDGTLFAAYELAKLLVVGYKQTERHKSILKAQNYCLHSLYRRHMPAEDELLRDLKMYWDMHGPKSGEVSFHDHMRTMIRLDSQSLEAMLQEMKGLAKRWDLLNLFSTQSLYDDAVQVAKKASGHYYDPIFKFENITGPEYAAMSRAFYMHVLSPTKVIPSILIPIWWNYISEICFMWTLQKKIYQLQAMERVIIADALKPVTQHSDITHHIR